MAVLVQVVSLVTVVSQRTGVSRCLGNSSSTTDMYDNRFLVCSLPPAIYHLEFPEVVVVCLAAPRGVIFQGLVQSPLDS